MKSVIFKDLAVGAVFTYRNSEYVKIDMRKITCCKFVNAKLKADQKQEIGIRLEEKVEIAE